MSKDLNKVQLTGRLGKDPEIRITPQGNTVTQFTVASNRSWKTADGQGRDDTEWFSVVAWNKLGEICGEYLRKGSRVYIEGRLQTRSWEDQESGQKRYKTEVIASDMIMLDSKRDMGGPDYSDADIPYGNEPEPEPLPAPTRQAPAPTRSAPARQPARATSNGTTATQPRRPVAPPADDDDLPF
jgi:single-strand DNA-binding protein